MPAASIDMTPANRENNDIKTGRKIFMTGVFGL
jgi:hypothetical protein